MKFYLDSAAAAEAEEASRWGWVEGITTNPAILAQSGEPPEATLRRLARQIQGPVFYQLTRKSVAEMLQEALRARDILGRQLVLKIAPSQAGFEVTARLSGQIPVAVTAIYHASQALASQAAGARFAMIYFHRALSLLDDGMGMASEVADVLLGTNTSPMAASVKSPEEVVAAAKIGYEHLTLPFSVLKSIMEHPISDSSIADFDARGCGINLD